MKKCLVTLLVLVLMSVHAFAEDEYKVSISGGLYGDPSDKEVTVAFNGYFKVDEHQVAVTNDKYYWKGYKIAGHDDYYPVNSNAQIQIKSDTELVACFGIPGTMVKYYVRYVDGDGDVIEGTTSDEYLGVAGDKIVLPYKYIEGYIPKALNYSFTVEEGKTYDFAYVPGEIQIGENGEIIYVYYDVPGQGGGGAGGGGGVTPTPGGNEEEIPDEQTPQTNPDDVIDIDDPEPPLAPGGDGSEGDGNEGSSIFNGTTLAVAGGVGAVGIVSLFLLLAKKKKEEEEEE